MAKDRKVIYTLALEADPGSQKVASEFAKQFKMAEESAKAATKAAKEAVAATRDAATKTAAGKKGGFAAGYDRAARDEARRAAADERREREQIFRERMAQERAVAREAAVSARQQAAAARAVITEQNKLISAAKQVAGGFISIGRAAVLFGVSGEENIEKAIKALAKFEAGVAAITGLVNIIEGGAKAWRAYAAATAAAAAAQRTLTAGGAAAAIGRGPVIAAGAAVAAVGATAGSWIGQGFLSDSNAAAYRRDVTDRLGITDQAGDEAREKAATVARVQRYAAARRGNIDRRYEESGFYSALAVQRAGVTGGVEAARAAAQQQVNAARANTKGVQERFERGEFGNALDFEREAHMAASAERAALQELIALDERRKAIAEETGRTKLAAAKEETAILRDQLAIEQQKRNAVLEEIRGAKEAIGRMSAGQVAQLNAIAAKANRGERLSVSEGDQLAAANLPGFGRAANEQRGQEFINSQPELQRLIQALDAESRKKLEAIQVKVDAALKTELKITTDTAKLVKDIEAALKGIQIELVDAIRREFEARIADEKVQRDLQAATSGA